MSGNENQESTIAANLCKTGCGFYGLTQFDGMCSVCYKEHLKKKHKHDEEQIQKPVTAAAAAAAVLSATSSVTEATDYDKQQQQQQSNSDRKRTGSEIDALLLIEAKQPRCSSLLLEATADNAKVEPEAPSSTAADDAQAKEVDKLKLSSQPVSPAKATDKEASVSPAAAEGAVGGSAEAEAVASALKPADLAEAAEKPRQKQRNRCGVCKKRIGLTGFDCRCGGVYCAIHRYSDKHECDFDYQSLGQDQIRKANPVVISSKIEKL